MRSLLDELQTLLIRLFSSEVDRAIFQEFDLRMRTADVPVSSHLPNSGHVKGRHILASLSVAQNEKNFDIDQRSSRPDGTVYDGNNSSDSGHQSTLAGSPLKLHDFQTGNKFSGTTNGVDVNGVGSDAPKSVPVKRARRLVSLYNLTVQRLSVSSLASVCPLWVVCDGQDPEHTLYLSSFLSLVQETGSPPAPPSSVGQSFKMESFSITSAECLIDRSKQTTVEALTGDQWKTPGGRCKTDFISTYDLYGQRAQTQASTSVTVNSSGDTESHSGSSAGGRRGHVEAEFRWERTTGPAKEPPLDAVAVLTISTVPGDPRSSPYLFYLDLLTLQGFVHGLKDGEVKWAVVESDKSLTERVHKFIEDETTGDYARDNKKVVADTPSVGNSEGNLVLRELLTKRLDLDFTERLWNILKDCTDVTDLTVCLQRVLTSLKTKEIQPMVNKSNETLLARLVRESYYDRMSQTTVTGRQALQILVEIGVEKLSRDYSCAFLGKDLITANHLSYYQMRRPFSGGGMDTTQGTQEQMTKLNKLHQALELVAMLEQYINLPSAHLSAAVRQVLKYYESHDITGSDRFKLAVQTVTVAPLLKRCSPRTWMARYYRGGGTNEEDIHKVVRLSTQSDYQHIITAPKSDGDAERSTHYFLTSVDRCVVVL